MVSAIYVQVRIFKVARWQGCKVARWLRVERKMLNEGCKGWLGAALRFWGVAAFGRLWDRANRMIRLGSSASAGASTSRSGALRSTFSTLHSTISSLQSAVFSLQSSVFSLQSEFLSDFFPCFILAPGGTFHPLVCEKNFATTGFQNRGIPAARFFTNCASGLLWFNALTYGAKQTGKRS
jgi:hypothetical protein